MYHNSEDGNTDSQDVASGEDESYASEANNKLNGFWPSVLEDVKSIKTVDIKNQNLPLTRIKKIMKLDEDVKMISAEAPILFAKAAEIFIHELTLRAWVHTENNRRRTLQRNDIAMAITKYDQFDFLIDIVPRDEIKTKKETDGVKPTVAAVNNEQEQYFLQLAQALQTNQTQQPSFLTGTPGIQLQQPVVTQHQQQDNNILHATTNQTQQQPTLNVINNQMLLQQVVSPTGEITNVPISLNQNQLNLIRMQLNQQNQQQPIIIAAPIQGQQQLLQMNQHPVTTGTGVFLNTGHTQSDKTG